MSQQERAEMLEEIELLTLLLDFHVQNQHIWEGKRKDFEEYADAVLDRINEIRQLLNEPFEP